MDVVDEWEDLNKKIQGFHLMKLSSSLRETFWTRKRSSKYGSHYATVGQPRFVEQSIYG
jgi:hypothetical protein